MGNEQTVQKTSAELRAADRALRLPLPQIIDGLIELLGARLVTYLSGVKESRAVRQWAAGERDIRGTDTEARLRHAFRLAWFIADATGDPRVAQAWFQGLNPLLEEHVPAELLRDGKLAEVGPRLVAAATAFIESA